MNARLVWKLKDYLEQEGITAYRLQTDLRGKIGANTVYSWVRNPPKKVDLEVLELILSKLTEYTGREVALGEILEVRYE